MILNIRFCITVLVTARFPYASRLVGLHARAANFFDKQTAGRQGGIAEHLHVHAESRSVRQQPVLWIFFD